ncbi:16S rRNA processing protein (RimM homologue), putative [Theileria annulata]|uniref:16S rRNA processing protein (RimM homologue), putative n=1 Tax=Theileria annulata TaxID=5874 RepID=Q4U8U9_THEAN|nr:16S rRNA processing protein (RimM homologue), putative [Theileria annulata]CAI76754.1 16S rRNA processing protein (RimM homologue), putative [Theileria annulata]|eukprot:XP_953379.1 16S rRNA processing protein (RimM homologue), putative [Theileria annulata]
MNGMLSIYYFIMVYCIPVESFRGYKINCNLGFRTNCSSNESKLNDPKELLESIKIKDKSENGICDDSEPDNTSPRFGIDKSMIYTLSHDDYVVVGKILGTYGLKGHVKVKSYTSHPEIRLCEPGYRYLKIPFNDERVIPINLVTGRFSGNKDVYIVKFEGFDNIQQSQRITNTYLTVPLSIMPPLEENTYYARDIIGLGLYLYNDINKTKLGNIISFIHHSDLAFKKVLFTIFYN